MDIAREQAYPTPFASSPLLPMLLLSLATQRNAPKIQTTIKNEYDYIIVGGGAAGSTLAARLSDESCVSVLLLEAGTGNPPLLSDVPGIGKYFRNTDIDWQYKTVPQKHTAASLVNRQMPWPSGKGLGGGSLLNSMMYVRGNRNNYDRWAAQGAKGWSFQDVYPYFIKLEDNRDPSYLQNGYHGTVGPLTVERPLYNPEFKRPLLESVQDLGIEILDSNGPRQTGFNRFQANRRNGQRCSTAKAYLVPAENRTNLHVIANAHVKKVVLDNSRAVGVRFDLRGTTYEVNAKREVILSAGSVNTAQLLMLSGIGPKEHLQELKIPVVADLPVGNNLQNHVCAVMPYALDPKIPTAEEKFHNSSNIQQYIQSRTGPLAASDMYINMAFLNSKTVAPDVDDPDYQLFFIEMSKEFIDDQLGLKPEVRKTFFGPYENGPMMACLSQVLQPKSRGTIRLQSASPYDPPVIDPNYLAKQEDVDVIVAGMKTCQRVVLNDPMKKVGAKEFDVVFPGCEDSVGNEDSYFTCITRQLTKTLSHPAGTAKMGDPQDPTTVVDPQLRVKGIESLRIVDASIMPTITSGNTNIPTIMIAEKAADIIKQSISCAAA